MGADLHRAPDPRLAALRQLPRPQEGRLRAAADLHRPQRGGRPLRARALRFGVGRALPGDRRRLARVVGARDPVHGAARRAAPGGLHTNTIEGLHRQIRKAIKTRGHFPDEQAATKLIYLALMRADAKWQKNRTWTAPRAALKIHFGDRFPG